RTGSRIPCARCGEPLPAHLVQDCSVAAAPPPPAAAAAPSRWTNRTIGLSILGAMFFMAAVGLTLALVTTKWRRHNDYRTRRDTTAPVAVRAPVELKGLGFLPADANVVLCLQVAEMLADAEG